MGPHPAVAEVRRAVRTALADLPVETGVLVALSGGADSLALAAATAFETGRSGRPAAAVVVDHQLQAGSAPMAERAGALAYELGLNPVHVVGVDVGTSGGPEAAARTARYHAIDAVRGESVVLLGHTRDDQAETVLLGLGRGSGPRAIAGMRRSDGAYRRPLLDVDRLTTRAACTVLGLDFWDDPHNDDDRFRRVRVRREVLPLLEDVLAGGVAAALARTADQLREDLEALDSIALARAVEHTDTSGCLDATRLGIEPAAIRTRVLRHWAAAAGVPALTAVHLTGLDHLLINWHGQRSVDLPGGFSAIRRSGRLHLNPKGQSDPASC